MDASNDKNNLAKPVLITGAAGFIGSHIARAVCGRGWPARALVHNPDRTGVLRGSPVQVVAGDILDAPFMREVVSGTSAVVHCAAVIRCTDADHLQRTNVGGVGNLVRACEEEGVKRFVFMSTPQVHSAVPTEYGRSKLAAERVVTGSALEWTILRPVLVYGLGDTKDLTRVARIVERWAVVPVLGGGKASIQPVHVADVAEAAVAVLERRVSVGKIYELAGPSPLSFNEFIETAARILGKRRYMLHIPLSISMLMARILEMASRKPLLTQDTVRGMGVDKTADIGALKKDLGISPRSVREGLEEFFAIPDRGAGREGKGFIRT